MKKILIVSPHFPPVSAPDLQRIRMSLPHYKQYGWEPVVLAVDPEFSRAAKEEALLETVPHGLRIEYAKAIPYDRTRLFGVGNIALRAWFHLWWKGSKLLAQEHFEAVFFSTTQFFVLPMARLWKWRHGVPYIIDIQDPWLTHYYYQKGVSKPPGGWKYHISHAFAWLLEGWTYKKASGFMSVSARYLEDLQNRYSWFREKKQATIRFGASQEDQEIALKLPPAGPPSLLPEGTLRFVYTGAAGPIMPRALNAFFDALQEYRKLYPGKARRFRFEFLGTSYAPSDQAKYSVLPIAKEWKVDDLIIEIPSRLGFLECLRHQSEADVLLLLGSSDLAYSPSKLYTYFLSGKPMFAPVFKTSVLEAMMVELNCARIVHIGEDIPRDETRRRVAEFLDDALAGFPPGALPERNFACFNQNYLAATLTERQCRLFDQATAATDSGIP